MPSPSSTPATPMSRHTGNPQKIPASTRPSTTISRVEPPVRLGRASDPSKVSDQLNSRVVSSQHAQAPSRSKSGPQSDSPSGTPLYPQQRIPPNRMPYNRHPLSRDDDDVEPDGAAWLLALSEAAMPKPPPLPNQDNIRRCAWAAKQRAIHKASLQKKVPAGLEGASGLSDPKAIWEMKGELEELQPRYGRTAKAEAEDERFDKGKTQRR